MTRCPGHKKLIGHYVLKWKQTTGHQPPHPPLQPCQVKKKSHGFFFFSLFSCLSGGLCTSSNDFFTDCTIFVACVVVFKISQIPRKCKGQGRSINIVSAIRMNVSCLRNTTHSYLAKLGIPKGRNNSFQGIF